MANGSNIKALAAQIDRDEQDLRVLQGELDKKFAACSKTIGGIDCSLAMNNGTVLVNIGQPGGTLIPAATFGLIVGWFAKHYGNVPEPTPAA